MSSRIKNNIYGILDYCALGVYLYAILSVFIPFFCNGHNEFFGLTAFLVKLATIGIAALKILLSFKDNLRFSLISSCALILGFGYYFFKYYTDVNSYLTIGTQLLDLAAVIIALHGISTRRVFRDYLIVRGTCLAVAVIAANLNIITSRRNYLPTRPGAWDMGMIHHNIPSIFFFFLALVWIVLVKGSKYRLLHYSAVLLIAAYLGIVTTSRTSMFVVIMVIFLLVVLYFYEKRDNKLMRRFVSVFGKCALLSPILAVIVSVGGAIIRNYYINSGKTIPKGFFYNMTSRFNTLGSDFTNHGIMLPWAAGKQTAPYSWILGGDISTMYSDNAIQVLVIKYGMVFSVLFFGALQYWAIKSYRNKQYTNLVIITALCVFSVMEHYVVEYLYNPFFVLVSTVAADDIGLNSCSILTAIRDKKTVRFWIAELILFVLSVVCMIPVFRYQIQSGKLHDFFFIWIVFVICLVFATVKITEKRLSKESNDWEA